MAIFECCILMPSFDDQIFRSFPLIFLQSVWLFFLASQTLLQTLRLSVGNLILHFDGGTEKMTSRLMSTQAQSPQPLVTFFSLQFCPKERKICIRVQMRSARILHYAYSHLSVILSSHGSLFFSLSLHIVNKKTVEHTCTLVHLYGCRHLDIP